MLDRVFAAIVALPIGALLVRCMCAIAWAALRELGHLIRGPGMVLLVLVLLIGAAAQLIGQLRGKDRRTTRERGAEERFVQQSTRRPATDVPLQDQNSRRDPDPAVNDSLDDEEGEPS
jgi:Na+-transporting methylmalonyl-CoA/oxaloacetate decarboxylase gamma subunit